MKSGKYHSKKSPKTNKIPGYKPKQGWKLQKKKKKKKKLRKWRRSQKMKRHSWTGRINTTTVAILLKAIYTLNAMHIKIPKLFSVDTEKSIQKLIWKLKR
jgi:hypothetical protein